MSESAARSALANVVGALALVVTDEMGRAVLGATGGDRGSVTDAAALSALSQFLDGASVDRLHRVLGLTPSGAVRLVDRLESDGLVVRGPGADGRSRAVTLTGPRREAAAALTGARRAVLTGMLDGFTADELAVLEGMLARMMSNAVNAKTGGAWICRLCDLTACERAAGRCPAMAAARQRFGMRDAEPAGHAADERHRRP